MQISWPQVDSASALVLGALTLIVGWLSYRYGVRSHDSHLRVEAMSLADKANNTLTAVEAERPDLFVGFKGLYAAQGRFDSGAMEIKRREFDDLKTTIEELRHVLATASVGIDRLSGRKLERRLVEIRAIDGRASIIRDKFAQYKRELREDLAEHRAQMLSAINVKQGIQGEGR